MSAAGNSEIKTGVQPPATGSGKDSKARTLKEPPDIWELVHETRAEFKPGSAFVGHLKSLKTLLLFVFLLVVGGGGVFGIMKFQVWSENRSPASPVPAETSKSVLSPSSTLPNQTSADQSTNKAPAPTEPAVSTVDDPKTAPAASSETKVSAASSDSKGLVKPRPQSSTNSNMATGEPVAARKKEKAQASKLNAAASPTTVRTDNKDGNQAGPTPAPKSDKPPAANPTVTKKETDQGQSPQLIAPAKSSATPKPKVIPWP
jgi:cytoskeletal protein RodZ